MLVAVVLAALGAGGCGAWEAAMARVSLKDIARALGLSESLVSKVLSGRMGNTTANAQVIKAIHRQARELGYRPNRTATALATGRHGVIAVFVHQHGEPGSSIVETFITGLAAAAAERQQRLWLQFFLTREQFLAKAGNIHQSEVDGLIVSGVTHPDLIADLQSWQADGLGVVSVLPTELSADLVNVGCDDASLTALATRHLLARGCRRLAQIGSSASRTGGFLRTLAEAGLPVTPAPVIATPDYSYQAGYQAARHWLAEGGQADGLVCQSDHQALAAVHALLAAGRRVPDEVRVLGIDDSPICQLSPVPLSSVSQQFYERGQMAVDLLLARLAGQATHSLMVSPVLRQRAST